MFWLSKSSHWSHFVLSVLYCVSVVNSVCATLSSSPIHRLCERVSLRLRLCLPRRATVAAMQRHAVAAAAAICLTSSPPHLLTSSPPHLLTSSPPHLLTSSPPHLLTSSSDHPFIPSLSLMNSRTLTLSALLHLPVFALFLHSAAAM
jgi:hypothetical protein